MSDTPSKSTHIFIDDKINIYEGEQAAALLATKAKIQLLIRNKELSSLGPIDDGGGLCQFTH